MIRDFFSGPAITRSMESSSSFMPIFFLLRRAVSSAASLIMLARSAPVKPGVLRASTSMSTSSSRGLPRACTFRISFRPSRSGRSTVICRSNRPGRSRAGSRISGRLVAAIMMIPSLALKPSISTSNWFKVCSRSSWPPPTLSGASRRHRFLIHEDDAGGALFGRSQQVADLAAPTPTNISTKSEPLMLKKGTPASPAIALASRVLPVPWWAEKQYTLGDPGAHVVISLGIF